MKQNREAPYRDLPSVVAKISRLATNIRGPPARAPWFPVLDRAFWRMSVAPREYGVISFVAAILALHFLDPHGEISYRLMGQDAHEVVMKFDP